MTRNPTWARDELLLALDVYLQNGRRYLNPSHPAIVALSELLNVLPIHPTTERAGNFRNPQGVAMKLANFMSLDPIHPGEGLKAGGAGDAAVWAEYGHAPEVLYEVVRALRIAAQELPPPSLEEVAADDESFPEGKLLERNHKARERNRQVVQKKLQQVRVKTGRVACEACGFDFATMYGTLGEGFAECHHRLPLSVSGPRETRLADLAVVCANCHRMLHRSRPMLSVEALRSLLPTA